MSLHLVKFQVVTMFLVLNKKRRITMLNIFRDALERNKDTPHTKGEEKKCKIHELKTKEPLLTTPLIVPHSQ